jgi:predicted metal-dependent hydrolase
MKRTCNDNPPGQLLQGIREFNNRNWFECHETVEDLWIGAEGETRFFYQGIIQIAVALHHWRNGNFGGAISLLQGGAGYLQKVGGPCQWVDVPSLISDVDRMRNALEELGSQRMDELDQGFIPLIKTTAQGCP